MADKQEELHYDAGELAEYFAGDMPDDEAAPLEAHLGMCPHCRA
jgi:anti-sigma factor RsiW